MPHIQWKDRYNIHFREIDAQHRGLLDLLNELIDLMDGRRNPEQVQRIFHDLADYAGTHFLSEERYMQAAGYPRIVEHIGKHEAFTARVRELARGYDPGDPHLVEATLDFLKHWYVEHISQTDQDYAPYLRRALPTASLRAVLFGLDGILCSRCGDSFEDRLAVAARPVETPLPSSAGMLEALETGTLSVADFAAAASGWAGRTMVEEDLARTWTGDRRPLSAMVQLLHGLVAQHGIGLVANGPPWIRTHLLPTIGLAGVLQAEVFSFEVGTRLPDPALLLEAAGLLKVPPSACLFIHDEPACLDAAHKAQFQTLHFTRPVMLMAELRRMAVPF